MLVMRSVGLKVLKNKLSEYVRLAAAGETVLVTDRDRVVAEIVPPQSGRSPVLADAMLAEAVREGWLTPAVLAGSGPPPRKPVMAFRDLIKDLRQDREER
jgi:antitoxin (DNA-binding transcriptional repressor) of toxin-antitoxin stability system